MLSSSPVKIQFKQDFFQQERFRQISSIYERIANYTSQQELIIYNNMFEDNPFADQDNPYRHLEMYEEEVWLQNMAQLSQLVHAQMHPSTTQNFVDFPVSLQAEYETLQFEPFESERPSRSSTVERSLLVEDQETLLPQSYIEGEQTSGAGMDSNDLSSYHRQAVPTQAQPQARRCGSGISFNTTDYIIKHCFKKMLDEVFREQVEFHCQDNCLTYSGFVAFWKQVLKRYAPNKHIGLTKFIKLIGEAHPAVTVCRLFFSSYLRQEYPKYITVGSMHNKQEYLRCATKLMYISCPPKMGSKNIQSARKL